MRSAAAELISKPWKEGKMKKNCRHYALAITMVGALVLAAPFSALAGHVDGGDTGHNTSERKTEDVKATIHNLSSVGQQALNIATGGTATTEVCVFCHTPHGANLSAPGAAPLWNRSVPTTGSYTMYNSPTFAGFPAYSSPPFYRLR